VLSVIRIDWALGVVLGLRQQIGRDPAGVAGGIGDHKHLRGTGDHVDADLAEHQPLGGGDIGIAGADDFCNRRYGVRAVSKGSHRLRAADAIDLGHAAEIGCRQHQRIEPAVRRRHHHHHARDAGDACRHRVHQHRGRIGGGAARHIQAHGVDRAPAPAEFDTQRIGEALVLRQLPPMENFDPVARESERIERLRVAGLYRRVDFGRRDAQAARPEIKTVEFARRLDQREVAPRRHIVDDGAGRALDIGRYLALHREKISESLDEIGAVSV
jgi:hypothetical protein